MIANAAMEQSIKGQIGQPAACMIEINRVSSRFAVGWEIEVGDYGPKESTACRRNVCVALAELIAFHTTGQAGAQSTVAVDNFVGNQPRAVLKRRKPELRTRLPKR